MVDVLLAGGAFYLVKRYGDLSDLPFAVPAALLLAAAGLVESKREGRYKFHHLNPRPLERIADRWLQADPKEAR